MPFLANDLNLLKKKITARYLSFESEVGEMLDEMTRLPETHKE
jgi:hypothetical protein